MADAEIVILAFAALGKTGQPAELAQGVHSAAPSGEDFVRVALVAHVPHQMVARGVVHVMQGDGQFHRAEVAGEMAAGFAHRFEQEGAQLGAKLRQLGFVEQAQILRQIDGVQQGGRVHGGSFRGIFLVFCDEAV